MFFRHYMQARTWIAERGEESYLPSGAFGLYLNDKINGVPKIVFGIVLLKGE